MPQYTVVIEPAGGNYSAYVPDLPGCITTGPTIEATKEAMDEAIALHLEGLAEEGLPIPLPSEPPRYVPHLIDSEAGVGTQVVVADVNDDGLLDVLTAARAGAFVFLNQR